jgi:DNA-binding NarL/FixJ family response regulator
VALSDRDVALAQTVRANLAQPYGPNLAQPYGPSGAATSAYRGLTAREREVLGWLAAGKTTAAVMRACQL